MIGDDEPTPPIKQARTHDLVESDDPAVYLNQAPTPEEHLLGEQVDLHNGAHVPFWMFAKLARREHKRAQWVASMDRMFRRVRRHFLAGLATLTVNLSAIGAYVLHRASEAGAAEERSAAAAREIIEYRRSVTRDMERLERDVRELREKLLKLSDTNGRGGVTVATGARP